MRKNFLLLIGILCTVASLHAQSSQEIKPLTIGDTVPDIVFRHMLNYRNSTAKLSEFRGKLVILDFWATWCTDCVNNMPHLDSIQRQFAHQVQIILINSMQSGDTKNKITTLFDKLHKNINFDCHLSDAIGDSIANSLFPHIGIPYYAWIDSSGKLIATTFGSDVTVQNIKSVINGNQPGLHERRDIMNLDYSKPLFVDGNGGSGSNILYRSILTGYSEGLLSSNGVYNINGSPISLMYSFNMPILKLYEQAYPEISSYPKNRIILNVKDSSRYIPPKNATSWKSDQLYTYQLVLPKSSLQKMQRYMRDDLEKYFALRVNIKEKKTQCLILISHPGPKELVKADSSETNIYDQTNLPKFIHNKPISILVNYLNSKINTPIINQTHVYKNVSLNLPNDLTNIKLLRDSLKLYGFDLKRQQRVLPFIVISESR